jgi:hypothetical protein
MCFLSILFVVHVLLKDLKVQSGHVVEGLDTNLQETKGGLRYEFIVFHGHSFTHYHLAHKVDYPEHVSFVQHKRNMFLETCIWLGW